MCWLTMRKILPYCRRTNKIISLHMKLISLRDVTMQLSGVLWLWIVDCMWQKPDQRIYVNVLKVNQVYKSCIISKHPICAPTPLAQLHLNVCVWFKSSSFFLLKTIIYCQLSVMFFYFPYATAKNLSSLGICRSSNIYK